MTSLALSPTAGLPTTATLPSTAALPRTAALPSIPQDICNLEVLKTLATLCKLEAQEARLMKRFPEHVEELTVKQQELASTWYEIRNRKSHREESCPYLEKRVSDVARDLVRFEWVIGKDGAPLTAYDESFFMMTQLPKEPPSETKTVSLKFKGKKLKAPPCFPPTEAGAPKEPTSPLEEIDLYWKRKKQDFLINLFFLARDKARLFFQENGGTPIPEDDLEKLKKREAIYRKSFTSLTVLQEKLHAIEDPDGTTLKIKLNALTSLFRERLDRYATVFKPE